MKEKLLIIQKVRQNPGRTALVALGLTAAGLGVANYNKAENTPKVEVSAAQLKPASSGNITPQVVEQPVFVPERQQVASPTIATKAPEVIVTPSTTASTTSSSEKASANKELSRIAETAYGKDLLNKARAGMRPLATAECNKVYYFAPKTGGPEVRVDKPISGNRFAATQDVNTEVPENNKFFIEYMPLKDEATGEIRKNPDGTTVRETRAYDSRDYNIRFDLLQINTALPVCTVALEKPGGQYGDVDVVGEIMNDNPSSKGLRISVAHTTYAEPTPPADPNTPPPEIGGGAVPPPAS